MTQRRVLGGEHPDTIDTMDNLGMLYLKQGAYAQAEPLFTNDLEVSRRLLGDYRPDRSRILLSAAAFHSLDSHSDACHTTSATIGEAI